MKVKMVYSVDLEQVPAEISLLLRKTKEKMQQTSVVVSEMNFEPDAGIKLLTEIETSRQTLYDIDTALEEIYNLVYDHEQIMLAQRQAPNYPLPQVLTESAITGEEEVIDGTAD